MKILQVQKFLYIHGGVERYCFALSTLLKNHKHKLAYFAVLHSANPKNSWEKYFVSYISFQKINPRSSPKNFLRMIYSVEARNKISQLLNDFRLDIVHLHQIYHHISPSILVEIRKRKIPLVMTVHDYHLISPNYNLFHGGKICEITKPNLFFRTIFHKCVKNSYLASFAEVTEKYIHYWLGWERNYIDYFIAPSLFMKNKLLEYGLPKEKIIHLPHFIDASGYKPNYSFGDYLLYFGRLSPEKGLEVLIGAMRSLPKIKLKIAGRGNIDYEEKLKALSSKLKNIEFVGFQDGDKLKKLIANSRFTILPSVWYENEPMSILESFASGKTVIASNIGGIPEIVKDGYNGFLFKPGNVEDCREKIIKLWDNPLLCQRLDKNARNYVEKNFGQEEHYRKLMRIYRRAITKHKSRL